MSHGAPEDRSLKARWISSEHGPFLLLEDDGRLISTGWRCLGASVPPEAGVDSSLQEALVQRLRKALTGAPQEFQDLAPTPGATPFQQACWERARRIPAGETLSYGALAESIGRPGAARAVGQAMRTNPLPMIIPCHRVIGRNGAPGGFSGTAKAGQPAMMIKTRLLERERNWGTGIRADLDGLPMETPQEITQCVH